MTTERCECGAPEVCPTPPWTMPLKQFAMWYAAHPSRRAFGQSRRSGRDDAREQERRK